MFQCKQCPKCYPTKNSLTRHERNHGGRETQHRCDTCGVVFYRKDVFLRHSRIHEGDDGQSSSSTKHDRQRCHTACVQCRRARAKCDGKQPCSTCISKKRKQCAYEQASSRLSHQVSPGASAGSVHSSSGTSPEQTAQQLTVASENTPTTRTEMFTPPASVVSPNHHSNGNTRASTSMDIDTGYLGANSNANTYTADVLTGAPPRYEMAALDTGTAQGLPDPSMDFLNVNVPDWQWLHQDLFFQTDPSAVIGFQSPEGLSNGATLPTGPALPYTYANNVNGSLPIQNPGSSTYQTPPSNGDHGAIQSTTDSNAYSKSIILNGGATESNAAVPMRQTKSASSQTLVIEELFDYAQNFAINQGSRRENHGPFWASMANNVQRAFYGHARFSNDTGAPHILQHFVDVYFERFHVLWTTFVRRKRSELTRTHPFLYLVMTSIGAMYEGVCGNAYGSMIHERIRLALLSSTCEFAESEQEPLWLCQSLLLTQLQALYFGQRRAFSYAQLLGCILVAQARRMNIFSARRYRPTHIQAMEKAQDFESKCIAWALLEEKTRLAYGIFRADVYMSVLLTTRPFISFEEMDIEASSYSYNVNTDNVTEVQARMDYLITQQDPGIWLSDLVRVALDRDEDLPNLEPPEHEVLIFGLQQAVWGFCNDTNAYQRLTGTATPPQLQEARSGLEETSNKQQAQMRSVGLGAKSSVNLLDDYLDYSTHRMKDMQTDNERLFFALQKWKQSFTRGQTRRQKEHERHFLLTGLLLYHLSYLRINAPIEALHRLSYALDDRRAPERSLCDTALQWLQGPFVNAAVDHAVSIWSLVHKELQRPAKNRARLNLFSFIGLHHSGVIVWMFACTHTAEEVQRSDLARLTLPAGVSQGTPYDAILCRENMSSLLTDLSGMFNRISPEWALRSSFAASAMKKANHKFSWDAITNLATERV